MKNNKYLIRAAFCCFLIGWLIPANLDAALICTVTTDACATLGADYIEVFEMYATANSHAGLPAASYANFVCCGGETGLGNACAGTYRVVARLSGDTNAHVEKNDQATGSYDGHDACLSINSGTVDVAYQANNCDGYNTTVASMSGATINAHVGDADAYTDKICASAAAAAAVSITITSDHEIDYQKVAWGEQQDSIALIDTQTVENGGGGAIDLEVKSSQAIGGTGWTMAGAIGTIDQFVHQFSTTTAPSWATFDLNPDTYKTATTSMAAGTSQNFDFRITVPDETTDFDPKSITITIHAVES